MKTSPDQQLLPPEQVQTLLDNFFAEHLPVTQFLNMRVEEYSGDSLALALDLQPSINDKLTAFGGSLYCLTVMNCWGMVYLQCRQRGIDPNMVVTRGEIDYLAPVSDEKIIARCDTAEETDWQGFFDSLASRGKARTELTSYVDSGGKRAVNFSGRYAVIGVNAD